MAILQEISPGLEVRVMSNLDYCGKQISGEELLKIAREARPNVDYRMHKDGHSIAAWNSDLNRYQVVAARAIDGMGREYWYNLPADIYINGKLSYTDKDFQ